MLSNSSSAPGEVGSLSLEPFPLLCFSLPRCFLSLQNKAKPIFSSTTSSTVVLFSLTCRGFSCELLSVGNTFSIATPFLTPMHAIIACPYKPAHFLEEASPLAPGGFLRMKVVSLWRWSTSPVLPQAWQRCTMRPLPDWTSYTHAKDTTQPLIKDHKMHTIPMLYNGFSIIRIAPAVHSQHC